MPHLKIRGTDHYYEWICQGSQSSATPRPVMVFLHGWGGSNRYWRSTATALADTFDCLLYDMRGFGQSPLPNPPLPAEEVLSYELETYADDLAVLLDTLEVGQVYLNAHSTGSSIAVFFLNRYPERVKKAILTCSGIFTYDEKAFSQFHRFGTYVVQFRPAWLAKIPFMDRLFMARFLHQPIPKDLGQAFLEDFLQADYDAALGTMITAVSKKASEVMPQEFAGLSVPTLLISGEYDQIIPADMGTQAAALSEYVQQVVIPGTAHFPMLEDPEHYLQCVQAFLKDSSTLEAVSSPQ
jgi:pimeloyl-ACP methyl ester carboxylesterase